MMDRRTVLRGLIAAPIVIRPGLLMQVRAMPRLYGDCVHDDAEGVMAWLGDRPFVDVGGLVRGEQLVGARCTSPVTIPWIGYREIGLSYGNPPPPDPPVQKWLIDMWIDTTGGNFDGWRSMA